MKLLYEETHPSELPQVESSLDNSNYPVETFDGKKEKKGKPKLSHQGSIGFTDMVKREDAINGGRTEQHLEQGVAITSDIEFTTKTYTNEETHQERD